MVCPFCGSGRVTTRQFGKRLGCTVGGVAGALLGGLAGAAVGCMAGEESGEVFDGRVFSYA